MLYFSRYFSLNELMEVNQMGDALLWVYIIAGIVGIAYWFSIYMMINDIKNTVGKISNYLLQLNAKTPAPKIDLPPLPPTEEDQTIKFIEALEKRKKDQSPPNKP